MSDMWEPDITVKGVDFTISWGGLFREPRPILRDRKGLAHLLWPVDPESKDGIYTVEPFYRAAWQNPSDIVGYVFLLGHVRYIEEYVPKYLGRTL